MTQEDIEKEIQARVDFKMNEFLTVLGNTLKYEKEKWFLSKGSAKYEGRKEAFEEAIEALKKERDMGLPADEMWKQKADKARNLAVDTIQAKLRPLIQGKIKTHEEQSILTTLVSAIEQAQRF